MTFQGFATRSIVDEVDDRPVLQSGLGLDGQGDVVAGEVERLDLKAGHTSCSCHGISPLDTSRVCVPASPSRSRPDPGSACPRARRRRSGHPRVRRAPRRGPLRRRSPGSVRATRPLRWRWTSRGWPASGTVPSLALR